MPDRLRARDLRGAASWLGAGGGATSLERDVVVVSPHLDDAIFSLGAAIAHAARRGAHVTVLTVLAGDPESDHPVGEWDVRAGFATAGQAARARRGEDRRACNLVGARPIWLPYSDYQYDRGGDDASIRADVVAAVGYSQVLLPGFPLMHDDHAWLFGLLQDAFDEARVGVYVEQPYVLRGIPEPNGADSARPQRRWLRPAAGAVDRLRKLRACRAYSSQVPLLEERMISSIFRYEARTGGESVAWARETA
ncbi:MAG TPA: PIG-L family deacetylase [Gaiellaceae bacterium]|jgi:LmbE family N-acetylglucosaminyl deacetylase